MNEDRLVARMTLELARAGNIWLPFHTLAERVFEEATMVTAVALAHPDLFVSHDDQRVKLTHEGLLESARSFGRIAPRTGFGSLHEYEGYLKTCCHCARTIYVHHDTDGVWRPYSSWVAGDAAEGEWETHPCTEWEALREPTGSAAEEVRMIDAELKRLQQLVNSLDGETPAEKVATVRELIALLFKSVGLRQARVRRMLGLPE